ncbi:MAG: UDP-N-acetylmuramate dehydrogenase [Oleispira sp.]|nr:UDP-N-acetylmuramate dehydrogenase [Oleispira sp.]
MQILNQFDLSQLNTLALPGRAEYFCRFTSVSELLSLLRYANKEKLNVKVLGGGSNIILQPQVSGLVVQSAMQKVEKLSEDNSYVTYAVDAGLNWHQWVLESIALGAYGLENLALIPGTVGASPIQNIGAYGVEVGRWVQEVRGVQISTGQWMSFSAQQCDFSYRESVFKQQFKSDFIITQVIFKLSKVFKPQVSYAPLNKMADQALVEAEGVAGIKASVLSAQQVANWVVDVRNSKLPNPIEVPNAGSFFTNPIVDKVQADVLLKEFPAMPVYPVVNSISNDVKVAAGWLIDQCGWKGRSLGLAKMHDQQALVLTLQKGASQQDLLNIQQAVQADVLVRFGIQLQPEPQPFG